MRQRHIVVPLSGARPGSIRTFFTGLLAALNPRVARPAKQPFGYHAVIDLTGCNSRITTKSEIERWVRELVLLLDMKAYGPCQVVYFGEESPLTCGYTAAQLIHTSNIGGHFVDATGAAHLDVFSCKPFDAHAAVNHAVAFFGAEGVTASLLIR